MKKRRLDQFIKELENAPLKEEDQMLLFVGKGEVALRDTLNLSKCTVNIDCLGCVNLSPSCKKVGD